jgi:anti-sigma B factor antagonist
LQQAARGVNLTLRFDSPPLFAANALAGILPMAPNKRIAVSKAKGSAGEVALIRFLDSKIIDPVVVQELADELFAVVDKEQHKNVLLNFGGVEFFSSAVLNKLIQLDKKVKAADGKLQLCNLKPEIFEIFAVTRLTQLFSINRTEQEALAAF